MKLKKFIAYTDTLLPHEVSLLNGRKQFRDKDRLDIFETVYHNIHSGGFQRDYSTTINKRKYSHLMHWMQTNLEETDTDLFYQRLNDLDTRIKSDVIDTDEEKELLKLITDYQPHHFHFIRFYEVVKSYLTFLLVRVRMNDYQMINNFIHMYQDEYTRSKELHNRITQATSDIVEDYYKNTLTDKSSRWLPWLQKNMEDKSLDGLNRYQSLVLLTYLAIMDQRFIQNTLQYYGDIEEDIVNGAYYSRKLLINYYGNKQLLLMKLHKHDLALHFGELSIKQDGPDYIMYLNNYSYNLMKLGRPEKALKLLQEALPYARNTSNRYNRTLFISSLIRCYNHNKEYEKAYSYAANQLDLYEKDILEYNWTKFFRNYIESLIYAGKYATVKKLIKKYKILEKEHLMLSQFSGYPYFKWFYKLTLYKEGQLTEKKFKDQIDREMESLKSSHRTPPSESILKLFETAIYELV
ncbi:tetratricopeptide repeat protein [Robertkochia sediminum]|uniref:tetratricopeptide repeat protein n=1 Tax=Robertkochia sediminum TaxID=2785326 RepID=UPI0019343B66|nr:hypothetical protein [Robertkochia sediminum]MBL7473715.1 hypothetical protein [Robertkochia sediminum]